MGSGMGASRESRESEKRFELARSEMRSLDKMLWHGTFDSHDIDETISSITSSLGRVREAYKDEAAAESTAKDKEVFNSILWP